MNESSIYCDTSQRQPDLVCLSHLRWNWVFQRPQQLMIRAAKDRRVFVFEEPVVSDGPAPSLALTYPHPNITVATPHIPRWSGCRAPDETMKKLLDDLLRFKE